MEGDITEKEAFRVGFLARCAEEGLTAQELQQRLAAVSEKQAIWQYLPWLALGAGGIAAARNAPDMFGKAIGIPAAAGLALGGALGYGTARVTEPDVSADDIKAQELAETYRLYAARAKAKRKAYNYRHNPAQ